MDNKYIIPELPSVHDLETKTVLKQLNLSIVHNKRKTGT